jgi:hypothetical protein
MRYGPARLNSKRESETSAWVQNKKLYKTIRIIIRNYFQHFIEGNLIAKKHTDPTLHNKRTQDMAVLETDQ